MNYIKQVQKCELDILDHIVDICNKNNLDYFLIGGTLLGAIRHKGYIPWDDDLDIAMPRKDYEQFKKLFIETKHYKIDDYTNNKNYWLPFIKIRDIRTEYVEDYLENYDGPKGIWVDIFPLDNACKNTLSIKLQFKVVYITRRIMNTKCNLYEGKSLKLLIKKAISHFIPKFLLIKLQALASNAKSKHESEYFVNLGSKYGFYKQTHLKKMYYPAIQAKFENKVYNIPNNYDYVLQKIYGKNYMQLPPKEKRINHKPIRIKFANGTVIYPKNEKI